MGVLSISDVTEVIVLALMILFLIKNNMTGKKLFLTHHLILFPFVVYNEITKVRIHPTQKDYKVHICRHFIEHPTIEMHTFSFGWNLKMSRTQFVITKVSSLENVLYQNAFIYKK